MVVYSLYEPAVASGRAISRKRWFTLVKAHLFFVKNVKAKREILIEISIESTYISNDDNFIFS